MPIDRAHDYPLTMNSGLGSDILYLNALGNDVIILNSIEAAKALLEKKSAIYSDR